MSMYGDRNVNIEALKRWSSTLSLDNIESVDIGGKNYSLTPEITTVLKAQLDIFTEMVNNLKPEDDWRDIQHNLSTMFYNAFFRHKNNAIHIANYYECLITPSNIKTYKKIIKGFDYQSFGAIQIFDGTKPIAVIGQKSDLIWSVFFEYFINVDEYGNTTHIHPNHEKYMSIQLVDIEGLSYEEINVLINELLLRVSMEHDMDFHIIELDSRYKLEGEDTIYETQFHSAKYEHIPTLYLNNALHTLDIRLSFLSYYQVFEYFFIRAQNISFLNDMATFNTTNIDHNTLRKILKRHKNSTSERESLKLVLQNSINIQNLKSWIQQEPLRVTTYCHSSENAIDLSKSDDKIISALSERIYKFRCSIAHAKGDVDEFIAVPTISESDISKELDIMKYLAYEVLKACSNI